ncbi:IS66 family insertion sequence element accessory protein TnpB [Rhizobium leguminosarum]|uniref:IS66 family insertion sequence element accessory protein TnpB n=1 Tax=Rhizobium leguminosarum TaxID=384 RepID=UPI003F96C474
MIAKRPSPEGIIVIGASGAVKVMIATKPVDFRKGAEGLAALVKTEMAVQYSGSHLARMPRRLRPS